MCDSKEKFLKFSGIFCTCSWAFLLFLLQAFYWWYVYEAATGDINLAGIITYSISAIVMILVGVVGMLGSLLRNNTLIILFIMFVVLMFILSVIQVILAGYALTDCDDDNRPFNFVCDMNTVELWVGFWVPTILILVGTIFGSIFAGCLKYVLDHAENRDWAD